MATVKGEDGNINTGGSGVVTVNATGQNGGYDPSSDTNLSVYALAVVRVEDNGTFTENVYDGDTPAVSLPNQTTGEITITYENASDETWLFVAYFTYCDGGVCDGDPHITTFDGVKYTL